jgi:hypothetical protein
MGSDEQHLLIRIFGHMTVTGAILLIDIQLEAFFYQVLLTEKTLILFQLHCLN